MNSFAPVSVATIFKTILQNDSSSSSCDIALRWMPLNLIDDKATNGSYNDSMQQANSGMGLCHMWCA